MELVKKGIKYYELIMEKTIMHDETADMIVPDTYSDIIRIISTSGNVVIRDKGLQNERILISGTVNAVTLYVPEDGAGVGRLELPINFVHIEDGRGIPQNAVINVNARIKSIETKIVNPRKISVKTSIILEIKVYVERENDITCGVEADPSENIEMLLNKCETYLPVALCDKSFTVNEEIRLPSDIEPFDKILNAKVIITSDLVKTLNNKAIVKGIITGQILYLPNDKTALHTFVFRIPFSHIMDIDGIDETSNVEITYNLRSFDIDPIRPSGEQVKTLEVTAVVDAFATAYSRQNFDLLADMYSTAYEVSLESDPKIITSGVETVSNKIDVRDTIETGVMPKNIVTYDSALGVVENVGGFSGYATQVFVSVTFMGEDGGLYHAYKAIPAALQADAGGVANASNLKASIESENIAVDNSGGILAEFTVKFDITDVRKLCVPNIKEAYLDTSNKKGKNNDLSLILRYADGNENLWDLAKHYNTTMKDILEANKLSDSGDITAGKLLLIPFK